MTSKVRENSKRQVALAIFKKHIPTLKDMTHREWRAMVLGEMREEFNGEATISKYGGNITSEGSLGAIYNDAKWYWIEKGECPEFGRHGKGSNGSSLKTQIRKVAQAAYDEAYTNALPKNFEKMKDEEKKEKAEDAAKEKAQEAYDEAYAAEEKRINEEREKAEAEKAEAQRIRKEQKEAAAKKRHDTPDGMKWKIVNKETGEITGYSPTKAAATKLKEETEKVIKVDEDYIVPTKDKAPAEPEASAEPEAPAEAETESQDTVDA